MAPKNSANSLVAQILKSDTHAIKILKPGDLVEGAVITKRVRSLYIDLGTLGTGVVYGSELMNAAHIAKTLHPGDTVSAKVVVVENDDGYVELSLAEAGRQKAWAALEEMKERGDVMSAQVVSANSGGLLVALAETQAFLPVSQLTDEHYPHVDDGDRIKITEELKKFIGTELKVKVITVNPRARKLIVSEKETANENAKELLAKYAVGDTIDGIISGVADFGAFMKFADNPAIEGLIHISELDHRLVENPKEIVKIGDAMKTKIIEIKDSRVSLSLKALKPNPWDTAGEKYKEGQEILGVVSRFNPFGAFISIDNDLQGLIHVSEFGGIEEMKQALEVGRSYLFTVSALKPAEKRMILKLKK